DRIGHNCTASAIGLQTELAPCQHSGLFPWSKIKQVLAHRRGAIFTQNVADHRRRAHRAQNETEASSRRSVHLHGWAALSSSRKLCQRPLAEIVNEDDGNDTKKWRNQSLPPP